MGRKRKEIEDEPRFRVMTNRKTGTATIREYDRRKCINKYQTGILSCSEFEAITKISDKSIAIFIENNFAK